MLRGLGYVSRDVAVTLTSRYILYASPANLTDDRFRLFVSPRRDKVAHGADTAGSSAFP